jgi:SAM-dependent methyltransferase
MDATDLWQAASKSFVLQHVPMRRARILEIGCGREGALALSLARAGHDVVAVDPEAPEGPIFHRTTFEEFENPGVFNAVVASLSLHHVEKVGTVLDKVDEVLQETGRVVVIEWAWDRFDGATSEWCFERLPARSEKDSGWLQGIHEEWKRARAAGTHQSFEIYCREWAAAEGLHSSKEILTELRRRFAESLLEWGPYFYVDLYNVSEADEQAAIDEGRIRAPSFRFVGQKHQSVPR